MDGYPDIQWINARSAVDLTVDVKGIISGAERRNLSPDISERNGFRVDLRGCKIR